MFSLFDVKFFLILKYLGQTSSEQYNFEIIAFPRITAPLWCEKKKIPLAIIWWNTLTAIHYYILRLTISQSMSCVYEFTADFSHFLASCTPNVFGPISRVPFKLDS